MQSRSSSMALAVSHLSASALCGVLLLLVLMHAAQAVPIDHGRPEPRHKRSIADVFVDDTPLKREVLQSRILEDLADMLEAELALKELSDEEKDRRTIDSLQSENFLEVFDPNNTFKDLKGPTKGELVWRSDVQADHPEVLAGMPSEEEVQSMARGTRSDDGPTPFPEKISARSWRHRRSVFERTGCTVRPLYVHRSKLLMHLNGSYLVIMQPDMVQLNFCQGECKGPITPGITHNLHFLNIIRTLPEFEQVTPPSCTPVKYKKSNLFVQLASGEYHRVTLTDMTIDECACR